MISLGIYVSLVTCSCFLNSVTGFVWSFIAPFILIFIANVGFFAVAARIMWRHQMKNTDKTKFERLKNWFRSAISVMMVMSLTWIVGILIVEVDEVAPLAYIYTIMVAFQGLFIFIVFVPLSSAVREAYAKWWRHKVNESVILSKFNISSSKLTPFTKVINNYYIMPTFIAKEFQFCYSIIHCVNEITKIMYYE